ncbi:MAG: ABC transporter permease [Calditrichia bacterium]
MLFPPALLKLFRVRTLNSWVIVSAVLVALLSLPTLVIVGGLLKPTGAAWQHIVNTLLTSYIINTLLLTTIVGVFTLLIGVSTAWLVVRYRFPGQTFLEWALMMPLAMPAYISAFTYAGMLDYFGPVQQTATALGVSFFLRDGISTPGGASFILTLTLYPYVYLSARASFLQQSSSYLEVARTFGKAPLTVFWQIALPLARPAIAGGLMLVIMETLNDYGVSAYYGVDTFTTGIFKAWFGMDDVDAAIRLSSLLMLFVGFVITLEYVQRGKSRYVSAKDTFRPISRIQLTGLKMVFATAFCALPLLFGFIIPAFQLLLWSIKTNWTAASFNILTLIWNSLSLALICAIAILLFSTIILYAAQLSRSRLTKWISKASMLGYSVPGVVIAVGVMTPFLWLDHRIHNTMKVLDVQTGLIFSGTIAAVAFGLVVRFLALAYNPIDAAFEKNCRNLDEASRILGHSPMNTLIKINIPLLKSALLAAATLVFVDVIKELPLTLFLSPPNFSTLATRAYELAAKEEAVREAAPVALMIVATSLIPVLFMNRMVNRR